MYKIIGADREEYGPVSADDVRAWITAGRADGRTMAQVSGSADWKPLSAFAEFEAALASFTPGRTGTPPLTPTAGSGTAPRPDVPTYLVWSILITVLCACVFGIPAIYYSSLVTSRLNRGDVEAARVASRKARYWCWVGFITGAVLNLISLLFLMNWAGSMRHLF